MAGERAVRGRASVRLAGIGLIAIAITVALYFYGRARTPNYYFSLFGQPATALKVKSELATVLLGLAVVQVILALWIYRKLPLAGRPTKAVRRTHRIVGFALFALSVPIAVHCMIAYGVQVYNARVTIHSIAGCFFYGAFVAKVLLVQSRRLPSWALPVAGGILAVVVGLLWYSSALWYYNG